MHLYSSRYLSNKLPNYSAFAPIPWNFHAKSTSSDDSVLFPLGRWWQWMSTQRLCPLTTWVGMTCWRGSTILCISPTQRSSSCVQVGAELAAQRGKAGPRPWRQGNWHGFVFFRSGVLPVHGHAVSRLHPSEEGQISSQTGTWIYTQL